METVRRDAHGPNLERLTASIARKTSRLACRKLGAPVPVHIVEADSRHILQFAPLPEAGNVVLQRNVYETGADRFCAALPEQIEAFASSIVADMRMLWKRRKEVRARVEEVREAAETGLRGDPRMGGQHSVQAIAVDLSMVHTYPISLFVEYRTLDEALRPGTVIDFVPANYPFEERVWPAPRALSYRQAFRHRLAALGANGLIDEIAEAVALAAPGGIAPILKQLATSYETRAVLPTPTGPLFATLIWRDGVIEAELSMPGKLDWYSGRLELEGVRLPEAVLASLPGKPLASIVELPFETDAKIVLVDDARTNMVSVRIDPVEKLVNLSTGIVWEAPGVDTTSLCFG